jgi:hypothetical protein
MAQMTFDIGEPRLQLEPLAFAVAVNDIRQRSCDRSLLRREICGAERGGHWHRICSHRREFEQTNMRDFVPNKYGPDCSLGHLRFGKTT